MAKPKGQQPQHGTHYHVTSKATAKSSTSKTRSNAAAAKGSGMKTKGGTAMKPEHC